MAGTFVGRAWADVCLAICSGLAASGCAASLAPASHFDPAAPAFSVGAGARGLLYVSRGRGVLSRGEGPVVGFEAEALARVSGGDAKGETFSPRASLLGGWSIAPMPYRRSPFGYEVLASVGVGRVPVSGHIETAGTFGAHLGVPIRFTGAEPPWRQDHVLGVQLFAVPYLATALHLPVSGAAPSPDFSLGIAFRTHLWSALLP